MTPVERAREMLPNMPDEVFNGFLAPLIVNDIGWPFRSVYQILDGTDWYRILYPLTLPGLSELEWKVSSLTLNKHSLCPFSQRDIACAILNKTEDVWAFLKRDSKPSRDSLAWHKAFIITTGRLFAPATMALTPFGIKILDGHHRIAAIIDLGLADTVLVDAWIGE